MAPIQTLVNAPPPLQGHCAPAFALLAQQFAQSFQRGEETGAALCVYHRGEKVVDLWGGWADVDQQTPWHADTLIVVFSVTKGLAAMALNLAAERGAFAWDAPVARYWPGFARNGKDAITVRQLFNHCAGLGHDRHPAHTGAVLRPGPARCRAPELHWKPKPRPGQWVPTRATTA